MATRLLVTFPDSTPEYLVDGFTDSTRSMLNGTVEPAPLAATVDTIAALDVVLSLARSCNYAHPDRDSSLREVEKLRATLREGIR